MQQAFIEPLVLFVRDDIIKDNIGSKHEKFSPLLLTFFFFILINNLMGLLPGAANVTGNIAVTLVLSLITFLVTTLFGNKNYWGHIFKPPGVPLALMPIMVPIEIIGMFTKPFALMIMLFQIHRFKYIKSDWLISIKLSVTGNLQVHARFSWSYSKTFLRMMMVMDLNCI